MFALMWPKGKYATELNNFVCTYIFVDTYKMVIQLRFNYLIEVQIDLTF